MKKLYYFFTYVLFFCSLLAQQNNFKETFPLAVGNKWIYSFSTGAVSSMSHSSTTDSGIVKLEIIGLVDSPDSMRWQFYQRREYYHDVYGIPASGWKKDSSSFEIIELKEGIHELYVNPFDKNAIFPYYKTSVDSEKIFRYSDTSLSNLLVTTRGRNNGYENDYYVFTFSVDTGVVKSNRRWYNASSMWNWSRYYLTEFHREVVSVHESSKELYKYSLSENYPNPFNPTTTINYIVPKQSFISITIYNSLGKEVGVIVNENKSAGNYSVEFDASKLASGIYFYQLKTSGFIQTKKMILLK